MGAPESIANTDNQAVSENRQEDTASPTPAANNFSLSSIVNDHAKSYEGFDPQIHASGADGSPVYRADGSFAKKRGRKAGKGEPLPSPGEVLNRQQVAPLAPPPEPEKPRLPPEAAARMMTNVLINSCVMIFGKEWEPEDKNESDGLKNAFKDYFDASGSPDIPPGFILVAALGTYAAPRIRHENTMSKIRNIGIWIKHKLGF